jgi:hypothetical protein
MLPKKFSAPSHTHDRFISADLGDQTNNSLPSNHRRRYLPIHPYHLEEQGRIMGERHEVMRERLLSRGQGEK